MPNTVYEQIGANVRRVRHVESTTEREAREAAEGLRERVLAQAQSAVGVLLTDLTVAQRNALLTVLLHNAGGLGTDMRVRALGKWVR
jgi:hypothetical protein